MNHVLKTFCGILNVWATVKMSLDVISEHVHCFYSFFFFLGKWLHSISCIYAFEV